MSAFPDHPFWDFSLDVYMAPGVGAACLELQERHDVDVNLLLFCLWFGASGRGALGDDGVAAATAAVEIWHGGVVRALRGVRTLMKGGLPPAPEALAESLRRRIQKIEIDCEHAEQLMLAGAVERAPDAGRDAETRAADAATGVATYMARLGGALSDADRSALAVIFGVAFPDVSGDRVAGICGGL